MFKKLILKMKKSVWLYPAIHGIISFIMVAVVLALDTRVIFDPERVLPSIMFTKVDLAQTILGAIAGSLLTMTTFTFSTIMVVLTMYTSQYSPRTVENFLDDSITMKVLGIFMGGFIYSILSLLFMRESISEYLVISATVGVIYSIICLVYFSVFINHVGNLIQANNLIDRLYREALENIEGYRKSVEEVKLEKSLELEGFPYEVCIKSDRSGYIQLVDKEALESMAKELSAKIVLDKVIGQFVTDETELLKLRFTEMKEVEDFDKGRLLNAITIGIERNELQDFDFSVQKIVEIALRAISPGINDPNTANHCIRILGVLMGKIADLEEGYLVKNSEDGKSGTVYEAISFEKEIYYTFYQIINYGKGDISVVLSIYKALREISKKASPKNRLKIHDLEEYMYRNVDSRLKVGMDGKMIAVEKADII